MRKLLTLFFLITVWLLPFASNAQILPFQENLSISATPQYPSPGETVTLRLYSPLLKIRDADIIWNINGKIKERGPGLTSITTIAEGLGSETEIRALVNLDGNSFSTSQIIRPTLVDFIWQSDSYTPPFYKGKALPILQSKVTVQALPSIVLPNGAKLQNKDLSFTWKNNDRVVQNQSGKGKDSYTFVLPFIEESAPIVEVEIRALSYDISAIGRLAPPVVRPSISFYVQKPLLGPLFNKTLPLNFTMTDRELTLIATPLFSASRDPFSDPELSSRWATNGQEVSPLLSPVPNKLIVRRPDSFGTASVGFSYEHSQKIYDSGSRQILLEFQSEPLAEPATF